MIDINDILNVIKELPLILQYVVPGYCCIILLQFTTSKKIDGKYLLVISCVLSYILLSLVSLLRIKWFKRVPDLAMLNSGISILLGIVIICILSILFQRVWFKKLMVKLFHKTPNEDIWRDVLDLDNGSNLKVYLKNEKYYIIGSHKNHEEKGDDSWLALSGFVKMDKETNEIYNNEPDFSNDNSVIITVRFSDIEHIEIF